MEFKTKDLLFSPIKALQAEAEARGAVSLAQGIPRFSPPLDVRRAAISAIESGLADFYGPPQGISVLREEVSKFHLATEKVFYGPDNEILITAGAMQGMSAALATLLSPGDELLIPSPSYFPFFGLPKVLGVKPVFVRLKGSDWRLDTSDLTKATTKRTRGILLCHPNNPTGTVYSWEELGEILKFARAHDLWVFVDEVYRFFVQDVDYHSLGEFSEYKPRVIRLMSFSKAFSLSGWRVGYLLADASVVREILKVHEMTTTASASLPAQYAALCAVGEFSNLPQRFNQILQERRARMKHRLEKLADYFVLNDPQGAYYFFVGLKKVGDDVSFSHSLLERAGVAVVPGSTFGPGGEGHLRLSFAARGEEIDEAFDRMERYLVGEGSVENLERILSGATGVTYDSRLVSKGGFGSLFWDYGGC